MTSDNIRTWTWRCDAICVTHFVFMSHLISFMLFCQNPDECCVAEIAALPIRCTNRRRGRTSKHNVAHEQKLIYVGVKIQARDITSDTDCIY